MNCKEVAKFLYAFADGELETRDNLQVLEHVNMCQECCGRVSLQQQLKGAIASVFGDEQAPLSLRDCIIAAIAADESSAARPPRILQLYRPFLAAAVIGLVVVSVWTFSQKPQTAFVDAGGHPGQVLAASYTDESPLASTLANNVYEMHIKCSAKGRELHNDALPPEGLKAAERIHESLDYPMIRCAKLDGREDTTFVSASYCQLTDADGKPHRGGHLIYEFEDGRTISLISVEKLAELDKINSLHIGQRDYRILKPSAASKDHPVTVTGFNCPSASHLVCVEMTPQETIDLVENMSVKYATGPEARVAMLAALGR